MTGLEGIGGLIESSPDYDEGRPYITGTEVPVGRVGELWACGYSAKEIAKDVYKGTLSLEQVKAALAVYIANRQVIDADMAARRNGHTHAAEVEP